MEQQYLSQICAPFSNTHNRPFTFPPTPPSPAPPVPHCDPSWSTCLSQPLDTMFGYAPFHPSDPNQLFDTLASNVYQKREQETNTEEELIMSSNGTAILHGATPSPSNSEEISDTNIQPKYTFQEMGFHLCHDEDGSNAGVYKRHQYHMRVDQYETPQHCGTLNRENTIQKPRKCHQSPHKYETTFLYKRSYSDNEGNQYPECLNHTHLQTQCPQHLRGVEVPLDNKAGSPKDFRSLGNVDDVIMLREDGSGSRQQVTVDDIRWTPLSQEDASADDLLAAAEAFDHTRAGGEGEFLHPQSSSSPCGIGEFINNILPISNCTRRLLI